MPVNFLSKLQRSQYGQFVQSPAPDELSRCFHLDDMNLQIIQEKRGAHNRLGFALQLCTLRYLGTFLAQPFDVPPAIISTLTLQLNIKMDTEYDSYLLGSQRWSHMQQIRQEYGYTDLTERRVVFSFTRWLYALCWSGAERPGVLFERAQYWLIAHKVILPGCSTLERFVSKLISRVETRVWEALVSDLTLEQKDLLMTLLASQPEQSSTLFERLRTAPVNVSSRSLLLEISRLKEIRKYHFPWLFKQNIPVVRIRHLSRYASTAKVTALKRMSNLKKVAALRALIASLEASVQDDILIIFEKIVQDIFRGANRAYKQSRQRTLKDMDASALLLAQLGTIVLDETVPDSELREALYRQMSRHKISGAVEQVTTLTRPHDKVYFLELNEKYRTIRLFLPLLLEHIQFNGNISAQPTLDAMEWLTRNMVKRNIKEPVPQNTVDKRWQQLVFGKDGEEFDLHAYTFCTVDKLIKSLKIRDLFIQPSWRYSDPRKDLLTGNEWIQSRPMICRALGLSVQPEPTLNALKSELDQTYRAVAARFKNNPDVSIVDGRLKLTPLEKSDDPDSLILLKQLISKRLPRIELPELILEVAERTGFTKALTHISEKSARAEDIDISLCAVLMAEACNTGLEPLVQPDVQALTRDRLSWVTQHYIRDETITKTNEMLVKAHNELSITHLWGDGTMAAADGMRFVVPVKTLHSGPNPKYFGHKKGITWYNLLSDQLCGLNDFPVPGTLKDSMSLLAIVLEQQTEIQPIEIMTDTGAYSDVIFGLFRLLGYRFSPRLADIGGQRLWRVDNDADYGELNEISSNKVGLNRATLHWEDILRLMGSLKLGKLSANDAMRTLQTGNKSTSLAQAITDIGRIEKTIHLLTYIDDDEKRRMILKQLNRVESRHSLARAIFHGQRGEIRKQYREG